MPTEPATVTNTPTRAAQAQSKTIASKAKLKDSKRLSVSNTHNTITAAQTSNTSMQMHLSSHGEGEHSDQPRGNVTSQLSCQNSTQLSTQHITARPPNSIRHSAQHSRAAKLDTALYTAQLSLNSTAQHETLNTSQLMQHTLLHT